MNRTSLFIDIDSPTLFWLFWFAVVGKGTLSPNAPNYAQANGVHKVLLVHVVVSTEVILNVDCHFIVLVL